MINYYFVITAVPKPWVTKFMDTNSFSHFQKLHQDQNIILSTQAIITYSGSLAEMAYLNNHLIVQSIHSQALTLWYIHNITRHHHSICAKLNLRA